MDNNEIHSKLNVFSAFVQKKLMEKNIISSYEKILLIPHYCMNIYKKQCSHYIIKCLSYIEQIDYTNRYIKLKYVKAPVEIGVIMKNKLKEKIGDRVNG